MSEFTCIKIFDIIQKYYKLRRKEVELHNNKYRTLTAILIGNYKN